jgi:S-(hydroxymethyl)glutathione dehydrogenase/alcohol dehydrogenase
MKTRAAVLWGLNQEWKVEEIDLHPPKAGEVLVKMGAAARANLTSTWSRAT